MKAGDCLEQSDHEIEFSGLSDDSKTAVLNFWRTDFHLFRILIAGYPWEPLLKGKGVQEAWMLLKKEILMAQEQAVPESQKASRRGRTGTDELGAFTETPE